MNLVVLKYANRITVKALLIGLVVVFIACNKANHYVWVFCDETYCSNGWTASNNNEALKQNVVDYYKGKGTTIYDLEIFSDRDAETNTTCFNKTGRRVKCKIKNHDLKKMKAEGFYE
jgi:hypothetical protein